MNMTDFSVLDACYSGAVGEMADAAITIAENLVLGKKPSREEIMRFCKARLGVESTMRDIDENIHIEVEKIMMG